MKWMFTIATVSRALSSVIDEIATRTEAADPESRCDAIEKAILEELRPPHLGMRIAYIGVVVDGLNATHRRLGGWISEQVQAISKPWESFVESGVALVDYEDSWLRRLLPELSNSSIRKASGWCSSSKYAALALLRTIRDATAFQEATFCRVCMVARAVGACMGDAEFRAEQMGESDAETATPS